MTVASSRPTPARYTYVVQSRGIKRDSFVGAFTTTLPFRPADTDWFFAGFCLLVFLATLASRVVTLAPLLGKGRDWSGCLELREPSTADEERFTLFN